MRRLVESESWGPLLAHDQLKASQELRECFVGLREGAITWPPTFKVRRVAGTFYKDQRVPSYCDRILWKSMPCLVDSLQQDEYTSVPAVSTSDHKPVPESAVGRHA